MRTIARRRGEGKRQGKNVATDRVYIGLDVRKRKVHAVFVGDRIVKTWTMPYSPGAVVASLKAYHAKVSKVVYEAGPTGFALADDDR